MTSFIHLHLHTQYSIIDGLVDITALCEKAKTAGMPAVAMTDWCNLFGAIKFIKTATQYGLKPILGAEVLVSVPDSEQLTRIVLLCQNKQGYQNLMALISKAYREGKRLRVPIITHDWLRDHAGGLIALCANIDDPARLKEWAHWFPARFYLNLQRIGRDGERVREQELLALANQLTLPVVATNAVLFLEAEDFEAHEARVCIQEGTTLDERRGKEHFPAQYFKSIAEMQALFSDLPEALENTIAIAKRCNLQVSLGEVFLPDPPVSEGFTVGSYLKKISYQGLDERLQELFADTKPEMKEAYRERLDIELEVIISMGFAGYFLIVADFIGWAKQQKIPVGPGRGSGAGSLVAFALKITDLDPIPYDLLFERFLNPERVSMPDFDIDFCMEHRDRVIEYVAERYGRDSVAQIVTFGTMAAKAVVRDCGRVLAHPYGFVDKIAKLIPFELGMTLSRALEQEPILRKRMEEEEEVKTLVQLALKLEGVVRNVGKHAGGVVIAPSQLTDFTPLYCEEGSQQIVVQYDKDDVEAVGLIKFDFLGLKTLTVIDWAIQLVNATRNAQNLPPVDINKIKLNDAKTFQLLKKCQTTAVFQLESRGMKDLIRRLQPDTFEDIIALVALFRPGPLQSGMVDDFINRKHGHAKVDYPHPDLIPILKPTYGVILYQEQVMQIAQVLAGYTLGSADLLRRAMGKKKSEEMAQQRQIFVEGAVARGVLENVASNIFDLMEKFAGYGFNKSHSAAYALVSYQTAWLKAHYPSAFMAAVLSADMAHTDKIVVMLEEVQQLGLSILPPNVLESEYRFSVRAGGDILYGLGAIKGIGENAIEALIAARQEGSITSLLELCNRCDLRKVNRRVFESLIRCGALDCLKHSRAHLMASLPECLREAERLQKQRAQGQQSLFAEEFDLLPSCGLVSEWPLLEKLQGEKDTLGVYLSGHPMQAYASSLKRLKITSLAQLPRPSKQIIRVAGLVQGLRIIFTKRGDKMGIITLEEEMHHLEVTVFSALFSEVRDLLVKDQLIIVEGTIQDDPYTQGKRFRAERIMDLEGAGEQYLRALTLRCYSEQFGLDQLEQLKQLLAAYKPGRCPVSLEFFQTQANAKLKLGADWSVTPKSALLQQLKALLGEEAVVAEY